MRNMKKLPRKRSSDKRNVATSMFVSIVLSVVFVALSGLLVVNSVKAVRTAYQRNLLLGQAESEVQDLRLRNLQLQQDLDYVMSESYVEEEARNRLLYAKNEDVLLVLPQTGKEVQDSDVLGESNSVSESENLEQWTKWWQLVRDGGQRRDKNCRT